MCVLTQAWAVATNVRQVLGLTAKMSMSNFRRDIWIYHRRIFHKYLAIDQVVQHAIRRLPDYHDEGKQTPVRVYLCILSDNLYVLPVQVKGSILQSARLPPANNAQSPLLLWFVYCLPTRKMQRTRMTRKQRMRKLMKTRIKGKKLSSRGQC